MTIYKKPNDFLYKRQGPWPQPCPEHPFGEAPAVLHIPVSEKIDWWWNIGSRYLMTLFFSPIAYLQGILRPGLDAIADQEFDDFLTRSMLAKFIKTEFDESDKKIFGNLITESSAIVDLEAVRVVRTFEGIFTCPSKVLLERTSSGWSAQCIHLHSSKDLIFPTHQRVWELAKYFVLQGGAICSTLVVHPLLHFPLDTINAITKTALPKDNLLFQLLLPHTRFTLYLEKAVLTFKSSLLQSKWWMPYAPYPGPYDGLRDLLVEGYVGIEGNVNYPPYKFELSCPKIEGSYGEYHRQYYQVVDDFVGDVLKHLRSDDWYYILHWVHYIHSWLPGFPGRREIENDSNLLQKVVTSYIFNVSIGHTIDHYNFGHMNIRKIPMRLRVQPPHSSHDIVRVDRSKMTRFWDFGKYEMARRLFFQASTKTSLINTRYDFAHRDIELKPIVERFKKNLRKVESELIQSGSNYMPLDKIAASIQF